MNCKMKFRITVIACGTALLIAAAVGAVVASRNRRQPLPPPDVPVAASPAEVRVKAVERKPEPSDHEVIEASAAVAIVCGADSATADRYEARNDALRSIARRRIWKIGEMDADHVTAWSKGGATDISNCQMLCKTHNRAKGNR